MRRAYRVTHKSQTFICECGAEWLYQPDDTCPECKSNIEPRGWPGKELIKKLREPAPPTREERLAELRAVCGTGPWNWGSAEWGRKQILWLLDEVARLESQLHAFEPAIRV